MRFFVEVVRQGGFSHAAKVLFATQPTVSKAVKQLEDELGVELLQRIGNRSELTDAGRLVYERGLDLLSASAVLAQDLEELRELRSGTLKVGFPRLGASSLFADLFAAYKRRYPSVDVHVSAHGTTELLAQLRTGSLELAAVVEPVADDLEAVHAFDDTLVALLPKTHPLARHTPLPLSELGAVPLILFEDGCPLSARILACIARDGPTPQVNARTSQFELTLELVASGVGAAFVSRKLAEGRSHRMVQPLVTEPAIPFRLSFAWRRGRYLSHAARAWLEMLEEAVTAPATRVPAA
jgi:DNA-binding transcriptional LysR family regulator